MIKIYVTGSRLEAKCDCSSDSEFIKELLLGIDFLIAEYFKVLNTLTEILTLRRI